MCLGFSKKKAKEPIESEGQAPANRRGRPTGSKNKKKAETIGESQNMREQAENSADPECSIPFFDSGDLCNICQFPFNDPIKKLKKIVKCPRCDQFVLEPCLSKTGGNFVFLSFILFCLNKFTQEFP